MSLEFLGSCGDSGENDLSKDDVDTLLLPLSIALLQKEASFRFMLKLMASFNRCLDPVEKSFIFTQIGRGSGVWTSRICSCSSQSSSSRALVSEDLNISEMNFIM